MSINFDLKRKQQGFGAITNYISHFQSELRDILSSHQEIETQNHPQGISSYLIRKIHALTPLSVFIPKEFGGWGGTAKDCLSLLEATSYESIAVGLMFGINGSLFIDPVAKYAKKAVQSHVFGKFIMENAMGGLMITEPDFGTEALAMQTAYRKTATGYAIQGTKHWGGLTGMADFWLVTAREDKGNGKLGRDIAMFVTEMNDPKQHIEVVEFYHKLGLFLIPYGRNEIDIEVSADQRLQPKSLGIKMLMDSLHRSRLRLSGIGMGFIKRLLDEAIQHAQERYIGGKNLLQFDQVQYRLAEIQTFFTLTSGLCHFASAKTQLSSDLFGLGLQANAMKALLTDMMQEAAQSLMQLAGAKGFRRDHIAGRAIVDCRPFQIFEGSNDVMYNQVAEAVMKKMVKIRRFNLYEYLSSHNEARAAAPEMKPSIDASIDINMSQRQKIAMGKAISHILALNHAMNMSNTGFRSDLIHQAIQITKKRVESIMINLNRYPVLGVIEDYHSAGDWKVCAEKQAPAGTRNCKTS